MAYSAEIRHIVITSIFNPTEAVHLFSKMKDYRLIVVGDNKTPKNWFCNNVDFISIQDQDLSDLNLAKLLPYNHYSRKMFGYLKAIESGAEYIVDTDDDNIPKVTWSFPSFESNYDCIPGELGFINVYQLYTKKKIWPRGLPLNLIGHEFQLENRIINKTCKIGIWQGLADENPDVDAIYRLTNDSPCYFDERDPLVLGMGTLSPFNTQNTMIRKQLFPLLYLPSYVTFRFTDILRGLVAQPIMWLYGYQLGFVNATVVQKRNPHDYMNDFLSEIPMYRNCEHISELVVNSISKTDSIETNLYNAYKSLLINNIICDKELMVLNAWLDDLQKLSTSNFYS